jgi:hypothetical protein
MLLETQLRMLVNGSAMRTYALLYIASSLQHVFRSSRYSLLVN